MYQNCSEKAADVLVRTAAGCGLAATLRTVFGKQVSVSVPMSSRTCAAPIDELCLGTRADNALRRERVMTLGQLADLATGDQLKLIRNMGVKSISEIKTKLLTYTYDQLDEREQRAFFLRLIAERQSLTPALRRIV